MYNNKLIIVLCVLGVVSASKNDLREIDSIRNESPCLSQGGTCTLAEDCSILTETRGLCPDQRSRGVECCYGISNKETRCQRRGGSCMERCNPRLIDTIATDCPKDSYCCYLVK